MAVALRWVRSHPTLVILLLVPLVAFGAPLLFGRVFLDGDDLIQNFPLRVLVGHDLRGGVPPLLDPYLYSGTPLLGGFNAGAAYPTTWLFAVLPSEVAWTLNLALAYDVALAGMYLFLRRLQVSSFAATMGAAAFVFAGFMNVQLVHIDLIEGAAWVPWMLLAVHALTTPPPGPEPTGRWRRHRRWWAGLLAVSTGMSILAGGPESFIDGATLGVLYLVYRLWSQRLVSRANRAWSVRSLVSMVAGVAVGVALGAAQLVPGLAFVAQSQRNNGGYAFFISGSLPPRSLALLVSPFALGTNQSATGNFVGEYNFPEVSGYVGILAAIAAASLLAARWRRRPESGQWWIWYAIMAVGVLAALGGATPFGHLLYLVPGLNGQRLLNRNLLLVDFSLAVLLGWWVHVLLDRRDGGEPVGPRHRRHRGTPSRRVEVVLTCLPVALVAAVCVLMWTVPGTLIHALGQVYGISRSDQRRLAVLATLELGIAGSATWVVLTERHFGPATLRRLLAVVMVVDLGLFALGSVHPPVPSAVAHASGPTAGQLASATGDGRFAIYDPDYFDAVPLVDMGQTDLNVPRQLASSQGYAALVDNGYYSATGAHDQEDLDPTTLAGPTWDRLNTRVLLSLPGYFVTPSTSAPSAIQYPAAPTDPVDDADPSLNHQPVAPTASRQWYFGGVLTVEHGTVPVLSGDAGGVRVGLVGASGGTRWLPASSVHGGGVAGAAISFTVGAAAPAGGLVVENLGTRSVTVGVPAVTTLEGGSVRLNGRLQGRVAAPHWVFTGSIGPFGVFRNTQAMGWAWAVGLSGGPAPTGTAVHTPAPSPGGSQRIAVHAAGPIGLVRSVAWTTGWRATVQPVDPRSGRATGAPSPVTVRRSGAVQEVALASGTYVVTFTYRPAPALVGSAVSGVTGAAVVGWAVAEWIGVRRRARRSSAPDRFSPG